MENYLKRSKAYIYSYSREAAAAKPSIIIGAIGLIFVSFSVSRFGIKTACE
ncbi:MAG: hypothetical protein LBQ52_02315 [Helicobacteraceae bacterium]|nr:hypothetical protein [Helicobacteraceae bacterium]